jgi:DNA-directed RNA polymerase specialized sigma24 family protein
VRELGAEALGQGQAIPTPFSAVERRWERVPGESRTLFSLVVECRFFAGLTIEETAAVLQVTSRTVERDWQKARAWLFARLQDEGATAAASIE